MITPKMLLLKTWKSAGEWDDPLEEDISQEFKDGDLDQWLDFKTTFEDTIINNSSLNNIQKFKYLQSSLSGDAASIIKGFSLTPDTFDKAWLALNERYHYTRDLAYKYCNNILNIKYIKVTNSRNIIELIDTVKLNLRNLELLGIGEEQLGNMLLTTFILKKIDSNMNKDFELSLKENTFPTLQDLLTFLEKHRKGLDHINGKIYPKEDNVRKTFKTYQFETKALIVKDLSNKIPNFYTNNPVWPHLSNLKLADPEFYIPRPIDIIIGADLYLDLIEPGLIKGPRDAPSAMNSKLGWIISGRSNMPNNTTAKYPSNKFSGTLTTKEIRSSELKITKVVQECYFSAEINALLSSKALPKTNKLLCLNPFIDQNGILRVGGRLKLSSLSEFQKHPIILPPKSHVTELIIRQCHQEHFHSSFNLTCSILRRTYWIVNGRSFVKQILKNCVQCFKVNARPNTQLMGELPSSRTTYIRSFARTGVDLAGPILTKPRLPRSRVKLKSYIALFVCFATKAIHLELVSDLSTGSFIAALRRFTSRRGTPSDIYSDNGTNFKGAAKFLNEQYAFLHDSEIQDYITYSEINWHFMPPHAPHFGGIWESNIKSVKMILKKVIGSSLLTFEELTTFLTQIEATLNQRPLTPLSEDPNDLEALTPAHFLSGPSTSNLPETDNQQANLSINLSSRWKHIQELKKLFILRWKKEYVINLQKRGKWKSAKPNVKIGDLVLIMEQSISSPSWILGRVSKTFHGPDMLVRTVELRTGKGLLRRPVNEVAVLPVQSDLTLTTGPAR
ncbi:hypothetical protein LAZ67_2003340, partial [Cordylochernes scorpioides]